VSRIQKEQSMFGTNRKIECLLLLLVAQTSVWAQPDNYDEPPVGYYQPVPPLPPDLGFTYHHASTAAEGWWRGRAAYVHAVGDYWLSVSQALICREEARWQALTNRERWLQHCIALRRGYELDRQRRIHERRLANVAQWLAIYKVYLLTPSQFNRVTGEIVWPEVLRTAEYDGSRIRLTELFRQRAGYVDSPIGSDVELQACVKSLARTLSRNIGSLERTDYLNAQKFLCGLKYEGQFRSLLN
jgi:hypothetical protein